MGKFNVDFYKNRKIFFMASGIVLAIGLIFNIIFGANLDIEFAGGAMIQYSVDGEVDQDEIASVIKDATGRDVSVVTAQSIVTGADEITVSFAGNEALSLEEQKEIATILSETFADRTFEVMDSNSVDPTMGAKFFQKSIICLMITVVILLAYIAYRFKKIGGAAAGVTAVIALVHDVLIIYFVYVVFQMSIDEIFIAVILTILGYSLNDTIVIYDRIRENEKFLGDGANRVEVMNLSLNQTLTRSILTSITTFIALTVVYIVATIYGLSSVSSFALPMMIGVLCGCYSSLFIAAPLFTMWQTRKIKE